MRSISMIDSMAVGMAGREGPRPASYLLRAALLRPVGKNACKSQKVQFAKSGGRKKLGVSFTPHTCSPSHRTRAGSSRLDAAILRHAAFHGASDSGSDCVCDPCRLFARRPARLLGLDGHLSMFFPPFWVHINFRWSEFRAASGTREPYRDRDLSERSFLSSHCRGGQCGSNPRPITMS